MRNWIHIWSLLAALYGFPALAQDSSSIQTNIFYEFNVYRGTVLDIHPFFPETETAYSYEINVLGQTRGSRYWHQHYNFPEFGVAFSYNTFGNSELLGGAIAVLPNFSFYRPLGDRFRIKARGGGGLAYFTKPFDALNNPDNFVIGSQITAMARLELNSDVQLSDQLGLQVGATFTHYSNGHFRVPNIGANVTTYSMGLRYFPKGISGRKLPHLVQELDKKWRFATAFTLGKHEIEGTVLPFDGPLYTVYGMQFYTSKRFSYKNHFKAGVDLNYYTAFRDQIISQELFTEQEGLKSWKANVFVGHEFFFGKVTFTTHVGFNTYFPIRERQIELGILEEKFLHLRTSNLLGCSYYFNDTSKTLKNNPFIGVVWKTIGGKADYVGLATGMAF